MSTNHINSIIPQVYKVSLKRITDSWSAKDPERSLVGPSWLKVEGGVTAASIYSLLKGGVTAYNGLQAQFMIPQRLEAMTADLKEQNRGIQELRKLFRTCWIGSTG